LLSTVAAIAALASVASLASPSAGVPVVKVTITGHQLDEPLAPGAIHFSPSTIKRGTVLLKITNRDLGGGGSDHYLAINGRSSADINAGATALLKVVFKRPGVYTASCIDDAGIGGALKVT
jgi:hypothetical protein